MLPERNAALRYLDLFSASGFVITQPVLSAFGRSADEFIYRGATSEQIVMFAVAVGVIPPVVLWVAESLVGLASRRALRAIHSVLLGALSSLLAVQVLKHVTSTRGTAIVVGAAATGVSFGLAYDRLRIARTWLAVASPAPVVFVLVFLFGSSVAPLVSSNVDHVAALPSSGRGMPPVVLIVFDEWPTASIMGDDGRVDAALYPNLARLADTATWYRNATSVTSSTWYAVPAIFTGQLPHDGQIPEASSYPESLFTLLGGTHHLSVSEIVTRVCPRSLCNSTASPNVRRVRATRGVPGVLDLLQKATSVYGDMIAPIERRTDPTTGFREDEAEEAVASAKTATGQADHVKLDLQKATSHLPQRFDDLLASLHEDEGPSLHVLHLLLPHVRHRYLPDGLEYASPEGEFGKVDDDWTKELWPPALDHERLLLQVGFVDRLIGELLDRLDTTGLLDRAVVIVTADHGIAFTAGRPVRGLSKTPVPASLYPELLWAPLFVKAPGQKVGRVSDANVMSIDVVPTIAKFLRITIPWKVDGVPAGERKDSEKFFFKATVSPFGVSLASPVQFDGSPGLAEMLRRNVDAITQPGDAALQPFRIGGEGALVGRPLASVRIGGASSATAQLENSDALAHVDKTTGSVPALVWGSIDRSVTVAVVVNGRIGGVSPTFADGGTPHRFAAMVPDRFLHDGTNSVRLFEVSGTDTDQLLQPIGLP